MPQGGRVVLDLAPDVPPLPLDRTRMRLLLRNLLDNALRHGADAAEPPQHRAARGGAGRVELEVRDFGPGVDEAQLEHLTEPFYRTDSARQRATGGVGLGMYLCRLVAAGAWRQLTVRNAQPGPVGAWCACRLRNRANGDAAALPCAARPSRHPQAAQETPP